MQLPGSCAVDFFTVCQQVIPDFLYKQLWPPPITILLFQQSTSSLGRRSGRLIAIRTPHSNAVRSTVCRLLFPTTNPVIQPGGDISITFGFESRFIDSPTHYRKNLSHHLGTCPDFIPPQSCWYRTLSFHSKLHKVKVKVKVTPVQALRLRTGRTAHRGSRGIALPFLDHGTRRG